MNHHFVCNTDDWICFSSIATFVKQVVSLGLQRWASRGRSLPKCMKSKRSNQQADGGEAVALSALCDHGGHDSHAARARHHCGSGRWSCGLGSGGLGTGGTGSRGVGIAVVSGVVMGWTGCIGGVIVGHCCGAGWWTLCVLERFMTQWWWNWYKWQKCFNDEKDKDAH